MVHPLMTIFFLIIIFFLKFICKLEKIVEYFLQPKKMLHYIIM